mmetsp:Transcript_5402/g.22112  ORF Transcript_5402/g.22112 Transcript_5402/m.22112 type:complete len:228 (+) Transcript_5402:1813-2496(+)
MVCPLTPHRDVRADRSPPRGISPAPRAVPQALESRPPGKPGTFQKTVRSGSRPARRAGAAAEVDVIRRRRRVHPRLERVVVRRGADDRTEEIRRFRSDALHGRHPRGDRLDGSDAGAPLGAHHGGGRPGSAPADGRDRGAEAAIGLRLERVGAQRRLILRSGYGSHRGGRGCRRRLPRGCVLRLSPLGLLRKVRLGHAVAKNPRVERQSPSMPLIGEREETCSVYVL